jgi:hypothetical protein
VTQTTATVEGTVNPNSKNEGSEEEPEGEEAHCFVQYGTSETYGSAVGCSPERLNPGETPVAISAALKGLTPYTTYHYRVAAYNGGGYGYGADRTFTTLPGAPTVVTGSPSAVTPTSATLGATVNPRGATVTTCTLEYGSSLPSGTSVPCSPTPGSGGSPVSVSGAVSGLAPSTTYRYRVVATNAEGTSYGSEATFTTPVPAPVVSTGGASSVTQTSATLEGSVNPNGGNVTGCVIEYGTALPSGTNVPCSPSPGSGTSPVAVSGAVGGLSPNTNYEFRVVATNGGGTSTAPPHSFVSLTQAAPEYGRCAAVEPGLGAFSSSKCTKPGGKLQYEWLSGTATARVAFSGATVKLETATKASMTCSGISGEGRYGAGPRELTGVTLTLTGCQSAGAECSSSGAGEGQVNSATLAATLVWTSRTSKKIALDFTPPGGTLFDVQCGSTSLTVDGSVLVPVKSGKAYPAAPLKFKASKGVQKPSEYEAGEGAKVKVALRASFAGAASEQIGLTASITQASEEPVEINPTI